MRKIKEAKKIQESTSVDFFYYLKSISKKSKDSKQVGETMWQDLIFAVSELNSIEKEELDIFDIVREMGI